MQAIVDLRSDTVTRPTPEMRRAMAEAEVGDDCYGEDPTVQALEEAFAERVGTDASVFVPSGIMGNQIALRLLTRPGDLVLAGGRQHIVAYEDGAAARNASIQFLTVDDAHGTFGPEAVSGAVERGRNHLQAPSAVAVENTHMASGGTPWSIEELQAVSRAARSAQLKIHLDGARLFHAEVATGVAAEQYAACADTVMCCLSKALGAPVGSMLGGEEDLIEEARRERRILGGAMRQSGVLAAAGLVALDLVDQLADDHERARRLADAVADRWPDIGFDPESVTTNVVVFAPPRPPSVLAHLAAEGVMAGTVAAGVVRLVTHRDVDDDGIHRAVIALRSCR